MLPSDKTSTPRVRTAVSGFTTFGPFLAPRGLTAFIGGIFASRWLHRSGCDRGAVGSFFFLGLLVAFLNKLVKPWVSCGIRRSRSRFLFSAILAARWASYRFTLGVGLDPPTSVKLPSLHCELDALICLLGEFSDIWWEERVAAFAPGTNSFELVCCLM